MGVYTFVCKASGKEWSAKQIKGGELEATAADTFELQRKLVQAALAIDSSSSVQSSFSYVTKQSAVFQVIIGGGGGGALNGGRAAAAAAPAGVAPAAEAAPAEEKKEEKEESDEDLGLSLFD